MRKVDPKEQARLIIAAIERFVAGTGTGEEMRLVSGGLDLGYALSPHSAHCDKCDAPQMQTYLATPAEDGRPGIDYRQDGEILCYVCALTALRSAPKPCPTCGTAPVKPVCTCEDERQCQGCPGGRAASAALADAGEVGA